MDLKQGIKSLGCYSVWIRVIAVAALCFGFSSPLNASPLATPDRDWIEYPDDEAPSQRETDLGKVLFFDNRLSIDRKRSCASCHNPDLGFGDGLALSADIQGKPLQRHTPHLYNLAWASTFFWDGRADSLEKQALMPIQSEDEMNLSIEDLVIRLNSVSAYREKFAAVYGNGAISEDMIARALAAFMRSLVSDNSAFDRFLRGESNALGPEAKRGLELFQGKAECSKCHDGANFTDDSFHNIGLPGNDLGRAEVVSDNSLRGAFKTPSLRNITLTAPYMHDGSFASLESVIVFYNEGGGNDILKSELIKPLNLSNQEISDLLAFLGTLESRVDITRPRIPDDNR